MVVAVGATLVAAGSSGSRDIPAEGFFKDYFTTDLQPAEILTAVRVPTYGKGTGGAYLKHRHPASSYAVVGVAAVVELQDGKCARASVVVGGVTVNPVRAKAAEAALAGQPVDDTSIAAAAARVAEAIKSPLSDLYASGEFRTHLATVLARRALTQAAARAEGEGPHAPRRPRRSDPGQERQGPRGRPARDQEGDGGQAPEAHRPGRGPRR